ncbi:DDE_Tnp_1_7 domain-containing protein [Trichonephila clavipes]|nr:DDE_Tnp_1_7 domain-containing protein [Trichonephila clavipes]
MYPKKIFMTVDFRFGTLCQPPLLSPVFGQYQVKFSVAAKLQVRLYISYLEEHHVKKYFITVLFSAQSVFGHLVNIPYADKMSHSKLFRAVEKALEYLYTLSDDEELIDICQLSPEESWCLTDEEDINENTFQSVLPAVVCGKIEISTSIDNDEKHHEDMFDPEELSITKGMPNLKRKLKLNEANVGLRWIKKHLAHMTGLYAMQKGEDFSVDENHIGQFFGLLLLSGYHQVPGEDLHWSTQEDLSVPTSFYCNA